jgi:hypothetical protein
LAALRGSEIGWEFGLGISWKFAWEQTEATWCLKKNSSSSPKEAAYV